MQRRANSNCTHRWVLGEPALKSVTGVCRRCGARRQYPAGLGFRETAVDHEELDHRRLRVAIDAGAPEEPAVPAEA